jgi:transcriptional regulator NrdR family protein
MKCPTCAAWTEINDTRNKGDHMLRRRECANGHRFNTIEQVTASRKKKDIKPTKEKT